MGQKISITIDVQTNAKVTPEKIAKIIQGLIDRGLEDAQMIIDEDSMVGAGLTRKEAKLATDLNISKPNVAVKPRVLVVVNGGVAEVKSDVGVDVIVFDWDNFNDDPDKCEGIPARFADLAEDSEIPVEDETVRSDAPRGG